MLRRVAPSLRRAILTSSAHGRAGAQLTEPGLSPRHALLPQWRLCSSAASTNSPPPPPPPPSSPPQGTPRPAGGSTVSSLNPAEVAKFAAIAETWRDPNSSKPLEGLKVIDVGCGGGILSEPLARMGATVTGIDAVDKNIKIARVHAASDPSTASIEYFCTTAEDLVKENKQFDAVISLEVIEHVANPSGFCESLSALTVPNGATVISTINRSMRAYATAIVAAEYILNWLPKGTHQWSKLVTPEELVLILERASISVQEMAGFVYNPLRGEWSLSDDLTDKSGPSFSYPTAQIFLAGPPSSSVNSRPIITSTTTAAAVSAITLSLPPVKSRLEQAMLRRLPPCLRRALPASSSSNSAPRRGVRLAEHGQSPPQSAPPPPSPATQKDGAVRTPGGGSAAEVAHFASFAETWWDTEGPFKHLLVMNPTRVSFIRSILCKHFRRDPNSSKPLEGLKIIDVGCAAGMLSEPLARMGATVTGIDAADESIKIARVHAASDPLTASIEYLCTTAGCRHHLQDSEVQRFLVIEHVDNPSEFCGSLSALTVPNGAFVISTINRSIRAFATMIIPKGTHHWSKLVTPDELVQMLEKASIYVQEMAGIGYNPWRGDFSMSKDTSVDYFAYGIKKVETPSVVSQTQA
uniref:Coenzyme Q3, methyltransferase n=1 Tax=Oryza rufipogon TaxID=4529 RepID=A0A0E0PTM7_ORYRU